MMAYLADTLVRKSSVGPLSLFDRGNELLICVLHSWFGPADAAPSRSKSAERVSTIRHADVQTDRQTVAAKNKSFSDLHPPPVPRRRTRC